MSRDASVSVRTRSGLGPLHMAAQGDYAHSVRLLLQRGAVADDVTSVSSFPVRGNSPYGKFHDFGEGGIGTAYWQTQTPGMLTF